MKALEILLSLDRPTSKAQAFSEWSEPPEIHMEEYDARNMPDFLMSGLSSSVLICKPNTKCDSPDTSLPRMNG